MLFNSYIFILCFLPLCLLGYSLLKRTGHPSLVYAFLILASLCFYGYFHPTYLFILIGSILVNYLFYILLQKTTNKAGRKALLVTAILLNLLSIFVFKYYDFFISNVNAVFRTNLKLLKLMLPLGISFFTFQQLSFQVDAYRGEAREYGFLEYALFVCFFPQLVAGPIVTHKEMIPQFRATVLKRTDAGMIADGLALFILGLGKKVLLADIFGRAVDTAFSDVWKLNAPTALCVMLAYTLQIYFDFSGYCDMAIGLGRLFGIEIPLNFDMPYKSTNISEFWNRWHMTLTRFFRTYLYFPLGGNRKGRVRTYVNQMIVFLVSGLWHGADWTFVLWGGLHGACLVFDRMFKERIRKLPKWFTFLFTFGFVNVAWALFRAEGIHQFLSFMKRLTVFDGFTLTKGVTDAVGSPLKFLLYLAAGLLIVLLCPKAYDIVNRKRYTILGTVLLSLILILSILSLSQVSTFLYFNF